MVVPCDLGDIEWFFNDTTGLEDFSVSVMNPIPPYNPNVEPRRIALPSTLRSLTLHGEFPDICFAGTLPKLYSLQHLTVSITLSRTQDASSFRQGMLSIASQLRTLEISGASGFVFATAFNSIL